MKYFLIGLMRLIIYILIGIVLFIPSVIVALFIFIWFLAMEIFGLGQCIDSIQELGGLKDKNKLFSKNIPKIEAWFEKTYIRFESALFYK